MIDETYMDIEERLRQELEVHEKSVLSNSNITFDQVSVALNSSHNGNCSFSEFTGKAATRQDATKYFMEFLYLGGMGKINLRQDDQLNFSELIICNP